MTERIVRLPEVKSLTGMSRSTIYLSIARGLFPRPIALGVRMVGWREREIAALNAARIRGLRDDDLRDLVRQLEESRGSVQ